MKLIFDIGMYDGSDTSYQLSEGYKVIAVEANPYLIEKARQLFKDELSTGQLELVNAAICNYSGEEISLTISGDDPGSSSIFEANISHNNALASYMMEAVAILEHIETYGSPFFY